jgi:F-type H+-transporting ATPase subunit b
MDQLTSTVGGLWTSVQPIVIRAIPTFVLVTLLYFFLKKFLFEPLDRTLAERHKRTMGAVEGAESALAEGEKKTTHYEQSLQDARSGIYKELEANRKQLADDQAAAVQAARARMSEHVTQAKAGLQAEAAAARASLESEVERLAEQIAQRLVTGGSN